MPISVLVWMLGEALEGITAGKGKDEGAGETERWRETEELNEERRLCEVGGGFIGSASEVGVPGMDGTGEPTDRFGLSVTKEARPVKSGGAGLLVDILLVGKSILATLL